MTRRVAANAARPLRIPWLDDDEPLTRASLRALASSTEDDIRVVTNVEGARAALRWSGPFDWVVCDYRLGQGSSAELVAELRERGMRVAILTGDALVSAPGVLLLRKPMAL